MADSEFAVVQISLQNCFRKDKNVVSVCLKSGKNMVQCRSEKTDLVVVGKNLCETALL